MMTGGMYGAVFGVAVSRVASRRGIVVATGLAYGAMVFAISTWIGLPIGAAIFDSGDQISDMAEMAGWGTFVAEHLVFGVALGLLVGLARARATAAPPN
jgi:hypothetical protein